MDDITVNRENEAALATALRALWERTHGMPAGKARVLIGPDMVTVWIEDPLSPAERAVAQQAEGQPLIQRYVEQLLATVQSDLWAQVEAIISRRIVYGSIRADVDADHLLCFFALGEQGSAPIPVPDTDSTP